MLRRTLLVFLASSAVILTASQSESGAAPAANTNLSPLSGTAAGAKLTFAEHMESGRLEMQKRQVKGAMAHYSQAVSLKPNDAYARKCLAYALVAAGYAAHGAQQMELAMALQVPTVQDLCFAADAYAKAGNLNKSLQIYQKAVAADGTDPQILVSMAEVQKKAGLLKEARSSAARALPMSTDPDLKRRAVNVLSDEKPQDLPAPQREPTEQSTTSGPG